jgi:vanillate O-demethylase monooxygenase subunit
MLEAQQQAMEDNPDAVFYNLNIDGGAMWARRIQERMIRDEMPAALRAAE